MYMVLVVVSILAITFFFLYIQVKKDLKSVDEQLRYTYKEESSFTIFSTSSSKEMKQIIKRINDLKSEMQDAKSVHLRNEKDVQDMIANISHDIRTPLTSIQGYVEMIQSSNDVTERERYYHIVMNRLHDLESMLDEFFLYTKLVNTSTLYTLEEKEVYPLVCQTLLNYMDLLKGHGLQPEVICDDESIRVKLHEESFIRICMNLIINTVRYGQNPFRIMVRKEGDKVCIIFKNHCDSSENIDIDHMFDRFYKGSQARNQKGSGLGLAIVKELCERMNAKVEAQYSNQTLEIKVQLHS